MKTSHWIPVIVAAALCGGCSQSRVEQSANSAKAVKPASQYVAETEPAGAIAVGQARQSAENDKPLTLVGRIGGSSVPFVEGMAAFTIVDVAVPYCAAHEGCPTPWDYCCTQDQVKDNIAIVKLVDENGKPVADDARQLLGVKELSTVVVEGTARKDELGNLTVAATKVFVRQGD